MKRNKLATAIALSLALGSALAASAWAADFEDTRTITPTGKFDKATIHEVTANEMGGNYTIHWTGGGYTAPDGIVWGPAMYAMNVTNTSAASFNDVNIKLDGYAWSTVRGLNADNSTVTIKNFTYDSDLIAATQPSEVINPTAIIASHATVTITGDTYVKSNVTVKEGQSIYSAANNGIYASTDGVINLTGENILIDVNSHNLEKIYDSSESSGGDDSYTAGSVKNDAVSGKYGGIVNINTENKAKAVKIYGNLDAKKGTVNLLLGNSDSLWHGSQANYNDTKKQGALNLTLANGAQWVPDGLQQTEINGVTDAIGVERITALTLLEGGIVNTHGLNEYTNQKTAVKELHIDDLKGNGGIFRMDVETTATPDGGRNNSDFVYIEKGEGTHYIQPVDSSKLADLTTPVWVADADSAVTLAAYSKHETIDNGFLYDYTPVVDKDVVAVDKENNKYGTNWYIVGADKSNTPTSDTVIADAAVNYATATARLEIDSLNKRLGELRDYDTAEQGAWIRFKGGEMEDGNDTYFNNKYRFWQIGWDTQGEVKPGADGRWHKGFALHYTDGESSYQHGNGENESYGASLYAGWEGSKGHYADYVLKYSHLKNEFTAYAQDGTAKGDYSNYALSASAEYGRKNALGHGWLVEPQAQLVYTYIDGADYTTSNGIKAAEKDINSLIGRIGFRLGREYNQSVPEQRSKWYLKADLLHEFAGDRDISLLSADGLQRLDRSVDGSDTWLVWGVGGDIALDKDSYFYCDLERSAGGDINTKWQANVGLRFEW